MDRKNNIILIVIVALLIIYILKLWSEGQDYLLSVIPTESFRYIPDQYSTDPNPLTTSTFEPIYYRYPPPLTQIPGIITTTEETAQTPWIITATLEMPFTPTLRSLDHLYLPFIHR